MRNQYFTVSDSVAIRKSLDKIFQKFPPLASDILTYVLGVSYLDSYFVATSHDLNTSDNGYLPVFGAWKRYGTLPEVLRKQALGSAILYQYTYSVNQFDRGKATEYFRKAYPNSEYLPQIDRFALKSKQNQIDRADKNVQIGSIPVIKKPTSLQKKDNVTMFDKVIHIDTSSVVQNLRSLKELHRTYFNGRKIFIDLWATWCRPCREQFTYKDKVDSLLELHNILPVFLSIDQQSMKSQWISVVENLGLIGYHFMVNATLEENIRKTIYDGRPMIDIPQYIYMDEDGNIIDKDAPRPSNIKALAKLFAD